MKLQFDKKLINYITKQHLIHNDFFLRYLFFDLDSNEFIERISFTAFNNKTRLMTITYDKDEIYKRIQVANNEISCYRFSSLKRILGIDSTYKNAFMHEYFSFYASEKCNKLEINISTNLTQITQCIDVIEYHSQNRYLFPLVPGSYIVTDTFRCLNSHRWCYNSEFAIDIGQFNESLDKCTIEGVEVLAACNGKVIDIFDGIENSCETTNFDLLEKDYGERVRVDGNFIILQHQYNEFSLYAHLLKDSILVRKGDIVSAGQVIAKVGSSGNSYIPHLHFHLMKDSPLGPGIPIHFTNITTLLNQPCDLDDDVNIVCVRSNKKNSF